jgi:hypothetical protein
MKLDDKTDLVRELCGELFPQIKAIIMRDSEITRSTWENGIKTGKAIEMLVLCGILGFAEKQCVDLIIPSVFFEKPDLFYLRNRFPQHHRAQAGHSVMFANQISLHDRFVAAITPRAIMKTKTGASLCVYREGYPLHYILFSIAHAAGYEQRPDLLIARESCSFSTDDKHKLDFLYTVNEEKMAGCMRIKNDINLPLIAYDYPEGFKPKIVGLAESTVGKGKYQADSQLNSYFEIIPESRCSKTLLVNGKSCLSKAFDFEIMLSLGKSMSKESLLESLRETMHAYTDAYIGLSN